MKGISILLTVSQSDITSAATESSTVSSSVVVDTSTPASVKLNILSSQYSHDTSPFLDALLRKKSRLKNGKINGI